MMEDREVGEAWEQAVSGNWKGSHAGYRVQELIRKLVEERCKLYDETISLTPPAARFKLALHDFGIDPETWEKHGN